MQGLVSTDPADVAITRAYLRHRPLTDAAELQRLASAVAAMPASPAQVQALEALGRHHIADRTILDQLTQLFAQTRSSPVQVAIAGVLIRGDLGATTGPQLLRTLQTERRPSPQGDNLIDALIRRLRTP